MPQQYFMEGKGKHLYADATKTQFTMDDRSALEFPYNQGSCLPMMLTKDYLKQLHVAGLLLEECLYLASTHALPSIVDTTNLNLTSSQKELLLWHTKLGHVNMCWIQSLAQVLRTNNSLRTGPILPMRAGSQMSKYKQPICTAC
jgi:hypothetical protein